MENEKDIKHSRNYLILNFLILLGYIFLYPVITNKINPNDYGNYIFAHSIAVIIVVISNLGLRIGYKRNFFEYIDDKNKTEKLLFTVQIFIFIIFIFIITLNLIFNNFIFSFFNETEEIEKFWIFLLLAIMLDSISKYYLTFLENQKKSENYFAIIFIKSIVFFIITFILLFNNLGILSLIYGLFISNMLMFLIVILSQRNMKLNFSFFYLKEALKISIPNTPKLLFGQLNAKADKILITVFSTFSNTAIYSIAQSLSYVIFQITTSLDKVFITETNKRMFSNKTNEIGSYLTPFIYFCSIPAIILILFNNIFLYLFIDIRYQGSENIIVILSIYYFTLIFSKISSTQLIFKKKVWLNSNIFILNVIINIALNIPFITYFGILGAAIATLLSSTFTIFISLFYASKFVPIQYDKKKIIVIYFFILVASIFSILTTNQIIDLENFIINVFKFAIIVLYLSYGFNKKIYNKSNLFSIIKFKKFYK